MKAKKEIAALAKNCIMYTEMREWMGAQHPTVQADYKILCANIEKELLETHSLDIRGLYKRTTGHEIV